CADTSPAAEKRRTTSAVTTRARTAITILPSPVSWEPRGTIDIVLFAHAEPRARRRRDGRPQVHGTLPAPARLREPCLRGRARRRRAPRRQVPSTRSLVARHDSRRARVSRGPRRRRGPRRPAARHRDRRDPRRDRRHLVYRVPANSWPY